MFCVFLESRASNNNMIKLKNIHNHKFIYVCNSPVEFKNIFNFYIKVLEKKYDKKNDLEENEIVSNMRIYV